MRQRNFPLMIFAAGFGTRMGALTAHRPKPLIEVAGEALLDRALHLADQAGNHPIVVNIHYLGEQIRAHLQGRPIIIRDESDQILETGGGLRAALPDLGADEVMTLNPDVIWKGPNPLTHLMAHWDPARMDALLLVRPRAGLPGRKGNADFLMAGDEPTLAPVTRATSLEGVVYLGAQIVKTAGLAEIPDPVFSLNLLWNQMIPEGRLYALIYPGEWCDVGSPEGLAEAEALVARP